MKNLLVVSAHSADWCTRSGGTLRSYVEKGWKVTVFSLTYGEHGESGGFWKENPGADYEQCKQCRKTEAEHAADVIGVSEIRFFDYGDYPLVMDETRVRRLTEDILSIRPDVVLTHWMQDPVNPDHETVGKAAFQAISAAGMRGAIPGISPHFIPDVFQFETTIPHAEFNRFEIDTYVDITDTFQIKMEAVRQFRVQPQLMDYYTSSAISRGFQATDWSRGRGVIRYAEAFKRYTPYLGKELPLSRLMGETSMGQAVCGNLK